MGVKGYFVDDNDDGDISDDNDSGGSGISRMLENMK